MLVGWVWFLTMLLPTIGVIHAGRQGYADRFTYWPMMGGAIGLAGLTAEVYRRFAKKKGALVCAAAGVLAMLSYLTWQQIATWHDSVTLFTHALQVGADNDYIEDNLGTTLMYQSNYGEAERHLLSAISLARNHFEHHQNLAILRLLTGREQEAVVAAERAALLAPGIGLTSYVFARALLKVGRYAEAIGAVETAVRAGFGAAKCATLLNDSGASLAERGRMQDAEILIRQAIAFDNTIVQPHQNLALILMNEGRQEEARIEVEKCLRLNPVNPDLQQLAAYLRGSLAGTLRKGGVEH